nr:MAG TPA: hypothetical protein [Caudoviricetes sp.]
MGLYRHISNDITSRAFWIKTLDNIYSCRRLTINRAYGYGYFDILCLIMYSISSKIK